MSQGESCGSQRGSCFRVLHVYAAEPLGIFAPADNVAFAIYASCMFSPSLSLGNFLAHSASGCCPGRSVTSTESSKESSLVEEGFAIPLDFKEAVDGELQILCSNDCGHG